MSDLHPQGLLSLYLMFPISLCRHASKVIFIMFVVCLVDKTQNNETNIMSSIYMPGF